jgi:predicted dehydrogenase
VAVCGTNSRGGALAATFAGRPGCTVGWICDVDERAIAKGIRRAKSAQTREPAGVEDFRRLLDNRDVDAIVIATPDHWHAPMAIMALAAGKHVYVEKPCGHNPREGELLIEAVGKHRDLVLQMGNQRRSLPLAIEAIHKIQDGVIGRPYLGKTWYANTRGSIGKGREAPPPDWLNWDLWQGPAPRRPYRDNIVHYNWHWFWHWGTGETCNNATHEVDVCRWSLQAHYPVRVASSGGRYHFTGDDWEFYDTQNVGWEFPGGQMITWEGRSCNGGDNYGAPRGSMIYGDGGSMLILSNRYAIYDLKGGLIEEKTAADAAPVAQGINTVSPDAGADVLHTQNFLDAIRTGKKPNSHIVEAHKSILLCHLGNLAQRFGGSLACDPLNGHIVDNEKAASMWSRDYEPGWEPLV